MRMIIIQAIFGFIGNKTHFAPRVKYAMIVLFTIALMGYDFYGWQSTRSLNVYENIGLTRTATDFQIEETIKTYDSCMNYEPECVDKEMTGPIFKLKRQDLLDIKYVMSRP